MLNEIDYSKFDVDLQLFSTENFLIGMLPKTVNILPLPDFFENSKHSLRTLVKIGKYKQLALRIKTSLAIRLYNKKKDHILQAQWKSIHKSIEQNTKQYDVAVAYSQGMPAYYVNEKVCAAKKIAWINCLYSHTRYNKKKDHKCYDNFENIVVVSELSREDILSVFPDYKSKISVIYDFISKSIVEQSAKEPFSWNDGFEGLRIVSILRMEYVKGPDIIVKCCKKLKTAGVHFKWHIIGGGGSMEEQIKQSIEEYGLTDDLILEGAQLNPFKYVGNADIYVQSSRVEGYCMALAEAKMLDVAVVSTDFLLVKEHIADGVTGLICQTDAESMFNAIMKFANDSEYSKQTIDSRKNQTKDYNKEIEKFYSLIGE